MDLELSNKTALVTGSSRGIGLAIAQKLHLEGCQIALNSHSESLTKLDRSFFVGSQATISKHVADVTQAQHCKQLLQDVLKQHQSLDILICNVGSGRSVPPGQESIEEWKRVFNVNLWATTQMVEEAQSIMHPGGSIVCISSICGLETLGAPITYSAAKAALNHYISGIARPLATRGIRINAVAPGNILTQGGVWEQKLSEDSGAVENMLAREVALNRLGEPEEIADTVAFLASPRSSFTTGAIFTVDGGQVRGIH